MFSSILVSSWICVSCALLTLGRGLHRRFDHVAHLGGALFGALYFKYGIEFWDWLRAALWDSGMEEGFREASKNIDWSDDESKK